jgi:ribonucleoside-triphosphate reductase
MINMITNLTPTITQVKKRDGSLEIFQEEKITWAIYKAVEAVGGKDFERAVTLAREVTARTNSRFKGEVPTIEDIQDTVEKVLIENGHAQTAKAYILYREKRHSARNMNALIGATIDMFSDYLNDKDWQINENANMQKSINGLNNYIREAFTKKYWLHEIYTDEIREAHESGAAHIHDLGFFGPYCAGWDLRQLLMMGFGGVPGKPESGPANRHLLRAVYPL